MRVSLKVCSIERAIYQGVAWVEDLKGEKKENANLSKTLFTRI